MKMERTCPPPKQQIPIRVFAVFYIAEGKGFERGERQLLFTQKMTAAGQNQSAAVICFVSLMQYKSYLCFAAESIASQNKRDDVRDG